MTATEPIPKPAAASGAVKVNVTSDRPAPAALIGTSNQAAVQAYAPPESIGSAAGLQRTAQYIGAITASSLIALAYGRSASVGGLHLMQRSPPYSACC